MVSKSWPSTAETASRVLSGIAIALTGIAAVVFLFPDPLADVFFAAWVLGSVSIACLGGFAAWTNRTPLAWIAALSLTAISILGMWSIGFYLAPSALLLLGSALLLQSAGPRTALRESIVADPPTVPETVLKTLVGVVALHVGSGFVYFGAISRDLFDACARETLDCTLANTHWDAVGITLVGLLVIGLGGWVLWKQMYVAHVLVTTHPADE